MFQRCPLTLVSNLVHDSGLVLTTLIDFQPRTTRENSRVWKLTASVCEIRPLVTLPIPEEDIMLSLVMAALTNTVSER